MPKFPEPPSDFLTDHDGLIPKPGETIVVRDGQIVNRYPTRSADRQYVEPIAPVAVEQDDSSMKESAEHGTHNVGRKLIRSFDDSPDIELEILVWYDLSGSPRCSYYNAKDSKCTIYEVVPSDFENGAARWVRSHARDCDGKPCECGANPPPKLPVWQAFQRVRADARKTPQYDESAWRTLESEILALIYPCPEVESCPRCFAVREKSNEDSANPI